MFGAYHQDTRNPCHLWMLESFQAGARSLMSSSHWHLNIWRLLGVFLFLLRNSSAIVVHLSRAFPEAADCRQMLAQIFNVKTTLVDLVVWHRRSAEPLQMRLGKTRRVGNQCAALFLKELRNERVSPKTPSLL